jgi:hypothetical protein
LIFFTLKFFLCLKLEKGNFSLFYKIFSHDFYQIFILNNYLKSFFIFLFKALDLKIREFDFLILK